MILPPTGGPPPKGAAVRGRKGPLKHAAADVKLKHCRERQEGSPGVTIQVNPPPPPPSARRRHKPPSKGCST